MSQLNASSLSEFQTDPEERRVGWGSEYGNMCLKAVFIQRTVLLCG